MVRQNSCAVNLSPLLDLTGDPGGNWEINRSKRNKWSDREITTSEAENIKTVFTKWRATRVQT